MPKHSKLERATPTYRREFTTEYARGAYNTAGHTRGGVGRGAACRPATRREVQRSGM